jgi:hypothetical protein
MDFRYWAAQALRSLVRTAVTIACGHVFGLGVADAQSGFQRPLPDTQHGIHIFVDGLPTGMSPAQIQFAAQRFAGTQKLTRADADLLRAVNPGFLILNYRLGMGLGYRQITTSCNPAGGWFQIIDGTWVQEWPGDSAVQEPWFFHWNGQRVLQCHWGWYLMELDNASWRTNWSNAVLQALLHNDDDGLFADSFMVPNFLGNWNPGLPIVDPTFENAWTAKLESFMTYMKGRLAGRYYFIPNVGWWVTTRDHVDFGLADGVFIEGFAADVFDTFGEEGWVTQIDRLMSLIHAGRAVIGESYDAYTPDQRLFTLATYLLIKGDLTYFNFTTGQAPEWWPEYDVPIGSPLAPTPASSHALFAQGVYQREYSNGRVLVNPGATTQVVDLGAVYYRAQPTGGGGVPWNGGLPSAWHVEYAPTSQVTLQPGQGAVLVIDTTPYEIAPGIVNTGVAAHIAVSGAVPGKRQSFFYSYAGLGTTPFPTLGVTLGLAQAQLGGIAVADANGQATWTHVFVPPVSGSTLYLQAAERGHVTNVAQTIVH